MGLGRRITRSILRLVSQTISKQTAARAEDFFADIVGTRLSPGLEIEAKIAAEWLPQSGGIVVDAGANRGEWSSALLRLAGTRIGRLVLIEPQASLHQILAGIGDGRGTVIKAALGRKAGTAELFSPEAGSRLASLTQRNIPHAGVIMAPSGVVAVTTLDEVAQSIGIDRIDVLKLDIEGHELEALHGAHDLLKRRAIGYVQFEFGGCNIDTRTYMRDFWHFFRERGYALGLLTAVGIRPLGMNYSEKLERFTVRNYAAWPE